MDVKKPPLHKMPPKKKASKLPFFVIGGMALIAYFFFIKPNFLDDTPDMVTPLEYVELSEVTGNNVFIDTRPNVQFLEGTVPRALNIPETDFSAGYLRLMGEQIPGYKIIVFGDPMRPDVTEMTARKLLYKKVEGVKVYRGAPKDLMDIITR